MSFDLAGLFNRQSQIHTTGQTASGRTAGNQAAGAQGRNAAHASGQSLSLSVGSTVTGQVVSSSGDVVQIEVSPGTILSARVEEGLAFQKGMTVSFEVSSVADNQIALRALFQNTAAHMDTITKAMDAAGLPHTADAVAMVNAMMEEGMPIDKAALQDMYRQVAANPAVSGDRIVAMNRLQIPVTEENIGQFEAYLNLEHQISNGVETIADTMADNLMHLISDGKTTEAADLLRQMMGALGQLPAEDGGQISRDGVVLLKSGDIPKADGSVNPESTNGNLSNADLSGAALSRTDLPGAAVTGLENATDKAARPGITASLEELMKQVQITDETDVAGAALRQLLTDLENIGISGEKAQQFVRGELTGKELLSFTGELLTKLGENTGGFTDGLKGHLEALSGQKNFQQAFRAELFEQWLMKPEDVADKQKVTDFYTRLSQQTGKLMESLQNMAGADKNLLNQVTNIHNNIEFMNQLNQTVSYVQLPLKLAGENAHGDLYVYTNKKGMAREDGNVSAFLHLDMEYLGPVDVYVAMQNQKVSTQFYLQDDEMLDFISGHIHLLNDRLEQKGYQMNVQMTVKEKPGNVMEEIMEDRRENIRIGEYSFDMRA